MQRWHTLCLAEPLDLDPNVVTRDEMANHASRVSVDPNDGTRMSYSGTGTCTEKATAITEAFANTVKTAEPVEQRDQHREPGACVPGDGTFTGGAGQHASEGHASGVPDACTNRTNHM